MAHEPCWPSNKQVQGLQYHCKIVESMWIECNAWKSCVHINCSTLCAASLPKWSTEVYWCKQATAHAQQLAHSTACHCKTRAWSPAGQKHPIASLFQQQKTSSSGASPLHTLTAHDSSWQLVAVHAPSACPPPTSLAPGTWNLVHSSPWLPLRSPMFV